MPAIPLPSQPKKRRFGRQIRQRGVRILNDEHGWRPHYAPDHIRPTDGNCDSIVLSQASSDIVLISCSGGIATRRQQQSQSINDDRWNGGYCNNVAAAVTPTLIRVRGDPCRRSWTFCWRYFGEASCGAPCPDGNNPHAAGRQPPGPTNIRLTRAVDRLNVMLPVISAKTTMRTDRGRLSNSGRGQPAVV